MDFSNGAGPLESLKSVTIFWACAMIHSLYNPLTGSRIITWRGGFAFESQYTVCGVLLCKTPKLKILWIFSNGAGGIRTPGTLSGHNSLAGSPIRPLSHRSKEATARSSIKQM